MTGPVAQMVALACHANAFLRGVDVPRFFPGNSTCQFCDQVTFVEGRWWLGLLGRPVAGTPDEWFAHLRERGAKGVQVRRSPQILRGFSDRMTAGLVGGGGDWTLVIRDRDATDAWAARWEVWNPNAPERRIWRVVYHRRGRRGRGGPARASIARAREGLAAVLTEIRAFSKAHDCSGFTPCFDRALESLAAGTSANGYHQDLCVPGTLSETARAVLDAAQSAWVFGGMGSWNDLGFEGEAQREYTRVSDRAYAALTEAICVAANESDAP